MADDDPETAEYTLTETDIESCRVLLSRLKANDELVGGYAITSMQGYLKSASATVRFDKASDPYSTAAALEVQIESAPKLGQLCKKVIAHYNTNMRERRDDGTA